MLFILVAIVLLLFRNPPDTSALIEFTRGLDRQTATFQGPGVNQRVVHLFTPPEVLKAGIELENRRKSYQPPKSEFPPVVMLTGQAYERVPYGHSMLLGGWESKPGRRLLAIVTPTPVDNETNVVVMNRLIEVDFDTLKQNNLEWLINSDKATMLPAEQVNAVVQRLEKMRGVDILAAPRIQVASGMEGNVFVGNTAPGGGHYGPSIWLIPEINREAKAIDLGVRMEIGLPPTEQ